MFKKIAFIRLIALSLTAVTLLRPTNTLGTPKESEEKGNAQSITTHALNEGNITISFEVRAPWNILDGSAEEISGHVSLAGLKTPNSLLANVAVQDINYKAGLSVSGRLVEAWLRLNPPTPAKFSIEKSTFNCQGGAPADALACKGTVDGVLNIWAKDYKIDIPVELKHETNKVYFSGVKKIKWGDYGFGDPDSTISNLKPIIDLNFSLNIPLTPALGVTK